MKYIADSTAKLCQSGKGGYVGREGVPMDNSSGGKCEPVIVFKSLDLSVCQVTSFNIFGLYIIDAITIQVILCLKVQVEINLPCLVHTAVPL